MTTSTYIFFVETLENTENYEDERLNVSTD